MGKEYEPSVLIQQGQIYTQGRVKAESKSHSTYIFFSLYFHGKNLNDEEFRAFLSNTCYFSVL